MANKKENNNSVIDLFSKLGFQNKINFYLKTDPKFYFDYKKLRLKMRTKRIKSNRNLDDLVTNAEKRRLKFMIDTLKNKEIIENVDELIKEYKKLANKYGVEIKTIEKDIKEEEVNELMYNKDYKNMLGNFEQMEKKGMKKNKVCNK